MNEMPPMESSTTNPAVRRRRRRSGLLRAVTCIGLIALLLIGWHAWNLARDASAIRALESSIRGKGQPFTLSDLAALYPPIPADDNAALPLLELWEQEQPGFIAALESGKTIPYPALPDFVKPGEPVTSEFLLEVETFLRERADHMTAIRSAVQRPRARFPVRIEDGVAGSFPHLAQLTMESETFRLKVLLDTDRGNVSEALDGLETMSRLSGVLAEEPLGTSQYVRLRILNRMIDGLKGLLSEQALSPADLDRARLLLEAIDSRPILKRWFAGDGVYGLSLFNPPDAVLDGVSRGKFQAGMRLRALAGLSLSDQRLMLEMVDRGAELMELEYPVLLSRAGALQNEANKRVERFPIKRFCAMAMPSIQTISELAVRLEARTRCAAAALAVERYRRARGVLPESLSSIAPEFADSAQVDPFNGEPLRFRVTEDGYIIYSVGPDLRDDGGDPSVRLGNMRHMDELLAVERRQR